MDGHNSRYERLRSSLLTCVVFPRSDVFYSYSCVRGLNEMFGLRFFSSRRRHTRYWSDWSSDVCSSDLKDTTVSQDITQDVFLQLWNHRESIDCDNNFEGYLFRITRNTVHQYIRRELLKQQYMKQMALESSHKTNNPEREIDQSLMEDYILELADHLPDARRNILLLYWKR